ncbi:hypothetical protein B296_00024559 [Ensete ventricosum]|uniref:Uncharacterized protein n=1 Tax=Ensete ventricosum TaxID=4639 RepID=A0A426XI69_ENSVE|nr:hypothetical protein B296_00024559 [Ensete ventricosum]
MALDDAINAKLEAIEAHIEDKLRALFKEFRSGRSRSPKRSQLEESSNHKENPVEKGDQALDPSCPRTTVDFPRWEDGDPIGFPNSGIRAKDGLQQCAALLLRRSNGDDQLGGDKRV